MIMKFLYGAKLDYKVLWLYIKLPIGKMKLEGQVLIFNNYINKTSYIR